MKKIAIIGGTGLTKLDGPAIAQSLAVTTALGAPSSLLQCGTWAGKDVVFLARHGHPHALPPHKVNYRANLLALKEQGVEAILAVNAVGGIHANMQSGVIAIPDQIIDYTHGRDGTFFDGDYLPLQHIDFTYPYSETLRQAILDAAATAQINVENFGVYGATQGPRLETIAEIKRMEIDGCDLVGMTGMPEAALARELGIPYASICLVVNPAAGKSAGEITMDDINAVIATGMQRVRDLLAATLERL